MRRLTSLVPELDFIVIGAQKAGTTSLWRYLEDNPDLAMPPGKEATFFTEPHREADRRAYLRALFKDAPRRAKLGTVTPAYMLGSPHSSVPVVAERIARAAPGVRLVALLRDPVERAYSGYRMAVSQQEERRSFGEAIEALLRPPELERAREGPALHRSYVVGGEYGRILEAYLQRFDRAELHIEMTADLAREPVEVVRRVCRFIDVEPHEPKLAGERFYATGRPRVSAAAEADLKAYLARHVWSRMRHPVQHREAFELWFRLWNVDPEPSAILLDEPLESELRGHYAQDARRLEGATGLRVPWR